MPVTRDDVARAYKLVLRRDPENESIVDHTVARAVDALDVVAGLLNSVEYRVGLDPYRGYSESDLEILRRHAVQEQPAAGYVIDFLGTRTDVAFNGHLTHLAGTVENLPIPANFHAEAIEWIGTLKAVESADRSFAVAEIGAGWGPWLVAAATAASRLGKTAAMTGVEADRGHFASLRAHLANNGFDPGKQRLFMAAIGAVDGWAFFPRIDSALDWGAAAVFQASGTPPTQDYRGHAVEYDRVEAISIATALEDRPVYDLAHIDIQGSERELIPAAREVLTHKVRWIVLGTHSRAIEGEMIETLCTDWVLEHEKPCRFSAGFGSVGAGQTLVDGAQVWRNRHF